MYAAIDRIAAHCAAANTICYWLLLPLCWVSQIFRNGSDILRVLDLIHFRPLGSGLVDLEHPWVTGIDPQTDQPIWNSNVIYRSPQRDGLPSDDVVLGANGRFMSGRVRLSAETPASLGSVERPIPHAINYIHGSSHYNSGIILLNDFAEAYSLLSCPQFRYDLRMFVKLEKREVLFLFRERDYKPIDFADLSCCMRTYFPWFCNPNGPQSKVIWGNKAPFAAANLITGHWSTDVYRLKCAAGDDAGGTNAVARPAIEPGKYLQAGPYIGYRDRACLPERLLAQAHHWRVSLRGKRGGMYFIDRRKIYTERTVKFLPDQVPDEDRAPLLPVHDRR